MRTLAEIARLRTSECKDSVDAVIMIAAGEQRVDRRAAAHVESCLRCQAEVAAYRRVLATMRSMRRDVFALPAEGVGETLEAIGTEEALPTSADLSAPAWAVRAACVGGITAASAAGMLVWLSRRRLGLPHAS